SSTRSTRPATASRRSPPPASSPSRARTGPPSPGRPSDDAAGHLTVGHHAGVADHALAIDVGTQSVRALLFDPVRNPVAMGRVPIEPYVAPQPGWAEQDPEVWWTAIGEACRKLWAASAALPSPVGSDAVAGVALTTQRVTLVVADEDNAPLRPAIVWLD